MVLVSAADREMTDSELQKIGDIVKHLPVFRDYDPADVTRDAEASAELIGKENGLEDILLQIEEGLPERLHETAYALACDVAAADEGSVRKSCVCWKCCGTAGRRPLARGCHRARGAGPAPAAIGFCAHRAMPGTAKCRRPFSTRASPIQ